MRLAQGVIERRSLALPKEGVKRVVLIKIEVRDISKQRRCRRLAIAIEERDTVTSNREILGQVDRNGRFAHPALEVLNRHDATRVFGSPIRPSAENPAHVVELRQSITLASIVFRTSRFRESPVLLRIANRSRRPAHKFGRLANRERRFTPIVSTCAPRRIAKLLKNRRSPTSERRDRHKTLGFLNLKTVRHMPTFRNCA